MLRNIILSILALSFFSCGSNAQESVEAMQENEFTVVKTEAEWKQLLTSEQYNILRQAGTERPFTSPLNKNYEAGTFICAACNNPLYASEHKFDSGTGWPSFDRPIEGGVAYDTDFKVGYERTELLCSVCGSHQGHRFKDGPRETTGMRHCINGVAMSFIPKGEELPEIID